MVSAPLRVNARRYTVAEAAGLLNVHVQTLRRSINAGRVPVLRIGTRLCIPQSSIDQMLTPHIVNHTDTQDK